MNEIKPIPPTKAAITRFLRSAKKRICWERESEQTKQVRRDYHALKTKLEKDKRLVALYSRLSKLCEKDRKIRKDLQKKLQEIEDFFLVNGITIEVIKKLNALIKEIKRLKIEV